MSSGLTPEQLMENDRSPSSETNGDLSDEWNPDAKSITIMTTSLAIGTVQSPQTIRNDHASYLHFDILSIEQPSVG
jgi:hypothetical protein